MMKGLSLGIPKHCPFRSPHPGITEEHYQNTPLMQNRGEAIIFTNTPCAFTSLTRGPISVDRRGQAKQVSRGQRTYIPQG